MPRETIGNPLSWSAQNLAGIGRGVGAAVDGISSHDTARPVVNRIGMADIRASLRKGADDFLALRSDVITAMALYPVIGFVLAVWAFHAGQVHLLFPLIAGFPLVGPVVCPSWHGTRYASGFYHEHPAMAVNVMTTAGAWVGGR